MYKAKVMKKLQRAVQSTAYPFDYNKNNPMQDFNSWAFWVRFKVSEIDKSTYYEKLDQVLTEAKIISSEKR